MVNAPTIETAIPGSNVVRAYERIRFRRPIVSVATALALTDAARQEEVIEMIEDGRIGWAWNVGRGRCREVRILAESINVYLAGDQAANSQPEFNQVLDLIFPEQRAELRAVEIAQAFSIGTDQVFGLHRDGCFILIKGSPWCSGPDGSPRFQFSSVVDFLKNRRIV